jgi:hypothetical protein
MVRWNEVAGKEARNEEADAAPKFAELSVVSLRREVAVEGRPLPVGTKGTVVAAYSDGIGYEVEFFAPFHAVVTVEANDLTA